MAVAFPNLWHSLSVQPIFCRIWSLIDPWIYSITTSYISVNLESNSQNFSKFLVVGYDCNCPLWIWAWKPSVNVDARNLLLKYANCGQLLAPHLIFGHKISLFCVISEQNNTMNTAFLGIARFKFWVFLQPSLCFHSYVIGSGNLI